VHPSIAVRLQLYCVVAGNVIRLVIAFVAFVLTGVPAAAVVCDLFLCRATSPHGCHPHAPSPDAETLLSGAQGCAHLSVVAPFVTTGSRHLLNHNNSAATIATLHDLPVVCEASAGSPGLHGSPLVYCTCVSCPLRI
jgi:hypothetical protein